MAALASETFPMGSGMIDAGSGRLSLPIVPIVILLARVTVGDEYGRGQGLNIVDLTGSSLTYPC
jgi:hypothetical protein